MFSCFGFTAHNRLFRFSLTGLIKLVCSCCCFPAQQHTDTVRDYVVNIVEHLQFFTTAKTNVLKPSTLFSKLQRQNHNAKLHSQNFWHFICRQNQTMLWDHTQPVSINTTEQSSHTTSENGEHRVQGMELQKKKDVYSQLSPQHIVYCKYCKLYSNIDERSTEPQHQVFALGLVRGVSTSQATFSQARQQRLSLCCFFVFGTVVGVNIQLTCACPALGPRVEIAHTLQFFSIVSTQILVRHNDHNM